MADLFVSYSHADCAPVSNLAQGLEKTGYEVWWDRRLRAHQDFGLEIEAALRKANCAIVAWSRTARDSLWVRAEATAAWEDHKLVQLSLDGAKPPLPFTMIHLLDFSKWSGGIGDPSWHDLEDAVESVLKGDVSVPTASGSTALKLGGFGPAAAVGGASLALVMVAAGIVGIGASGVFSTNLFGVITGGMFLTALLAFAHMLTRVIRISLASR